MTSITALREGSRVVNRHWKIVLLLYLSNLAVALAIIAPIAAGIFSDLSGSFYGERQFTGVDLSWISQFGSEYHWTQLTWAIAALVAAGILWILLSAFLSGGTIAVLHREDDSFFGACARYFPRLFRLLLVSLVFYFLVVLINGGIGSLIRHASEDSMVGRPWTILGWLQRLLFFFLLGVVNMIFDYGKIIAVVDNTKAIRSTRRALAFVFRNGGRTLALYWLASAIGWGIFAAYHGLTELTGQETAMAVFLVFLIRQIYMVARTWIRLWIWGGELKLYYLPTSEPSLGLNSPPLTNMENTSADLA